MIQLVDQPHGGHLMSMMNGVHQIRSSSLASMNLEETDPSSSLMSKLANEQGPLKMRDWQVHFKLWGVTQADLDRHGITQ